MKPRSKYGSVRTEVDGIAFHSKGEAKRYQELMMLVRAGKIKNLFLQRRFPLSAGPLRFVIGYYVADFVYDEGREQIVEDFKGTWTPLAKWKIAHFTAEYQLDVRITGRAQRRQRGR